MSGERGLQNVYILGEDEELIVRAKESFKDGEKERKPGDQWTIRGPREYVPPGEVEVVPKRKTNPVDEVRDFKTRRLETPQVIAATQLQPVTPATLSKMPQTAPTPEKTVFTPGSVTIPSNASINLNLQQKGSVGKVSQLTPQQMQILQRKQIPLHKNQTQKVNATPMLNAVQIIQQQGGRSLTVHQLNQLIKQHPQGLPQIIQTTPTIIATVTKSQATQPQITKVIRTVGNIQTSQMQTIPVSATTISGIVTTSGPSVSQVPSLHISSIAPGQSSVTASIVKPGSITTQDGVTTVQIHPVSTLSQARVSAGLPQNVVVQPMQHVTVATPPASQHGGSAQQQVTLTSPVVMSQLIHSNSHTDNRAAPDSGTHTTGTHYCDSPEEL